LDVEIQLRDYREVTEPFDRVVSVGMVEHVGHKNYRTSMRAAARSLGEDGLFLCQGICGNVSRFHADPWITRYIFPNSVLPSVAGLTRAAEGVFIVEDVKNIGPNYDPTLLAWEENVRRAWPRFADRYGERFRRMWRFYLLSCAGAFRARSLQVFSILFSKEATAIGSSVRDTAAETPPPVTFESPVRMSRQSRRASLGDEERSFNSACRCEHNTSRHALGCVWLAGAGGAFDAKLRA
jgi:cyclopropane-fatty-acyl-phospholipid synthase